MASRKKFKIKKTYITYQEPVGVPYGDTSLEAELSEGATQPPIDRPPPPDPPAQLTISETNAATSPSRQQTQGPRDDQEGEFVWPNDVRMCIDTKSKGMQAYGYVKDNIELHQNIVLTPRMLTPSMLTRTQTPVDTYTSGLIDSHPISRAVLRRHNKKYNITDDINDNINVDSPNRSAGLYWRGDLATTSLKGRHSEQFLVGSKKNTTPRRKFLPLCIDSAISDLEKSWADSYDRRDIILLHSVNLTNPLFLAILYRSAFVSIRYKHLYARNLQHQILLPRSSCGCRPYSDCIVRTMTCLTRLHEDICNTLISVKRANPQWLSCMHAMQESTSKYLVYHCDSEYKFPYKFIEFPHFVVINLHRGGEDIKLALLYMQVPPYYFGIPVSLHERPVTTPEEYQDLILSSGERQEIHQYFPVIIEKVNERLEVERETFFAHHPDGSDLRRNTRLLQIYPYRFDEEGKPDWCRYLDITIHNNIEQD